MGRERVYEALRADWLERKRGMTEEDEWRARLCIVMMYYQTI